MIPDCFYPYPPNVEFDYETQTFWDTDGNRFASPRRKTPDSEEWIWFLVPENKGPEYAQRSVSFTFRSEKHSYNWATQALDESNVPRGYTAYLKTLKRKDKKKMDPQDEERFEEANTGFTEEKEEVEETRELEQTFFPKTPKPMSLEEITPKPTLPPKPVAIKTTINTAITGDPSWMNAGEEKSSITTSGSIIAMPDNYDGKPENFTTFWALAKAFMSLNEKQFPMAQHKVLFILSRCKGGKAGPWATAQILDKTRTNDWGTWDDFETQFKQSFYPALTKKEAYMKLAHLKITEHMRLTDFEALWDTYTTQAEITPDITHWHHFLSKLPRKINMELLRLEREPKDYDGWRKAARKADSIVHQDHYEVNNFSKWWTEDKPKEEPYQLNAVSDAE